MQTFQLQNLCSPLLTMGTDFPAWIWQGLMLCPFKFRILLTADDIWSQCHSQICIHRWFYIKSMKSGANSLSIKKNTFTDSEYARSYTKLFLKHNICIESGLNSQIMTNQIWVKWTSTIQNWSSWGPPCTPRSSRWENKNKTFGRLASKLLIHSQQSHNL